MYLLVAQQEAQRAMFIVEKAKQERQEKVVRAEGEAEAARLISFTFQLSKQEGQNFTLGGWGGGGGDISCLPLCVNGGS